eukprot:16229_1
MNVLQAFVMLFFVALVAVSASDAHDDDGKRSLRLGMPRILSGGGGDDHSSDNDANVNDANVEEERKKKKGNRWGKNELRKRGNKKTTKGPRKRQYQHGQNGEKKANGGN